MIEGHRFLDNVIPQDKVQELLKGSGSIVIDTKVFHKKFDSFIENISDIDFKTFAKVYDTNKVYNEKKIKCRNQKKKS